MKNKEAAELLGEIILDLNQIITECEDKELQNKLMCMDKQITKFCKAARIEPLTIRGIALAGYKQEDGERD